MLGERDNQSPTNAASEPEAAKPVMGSVDKVRAFAASKMSPLANPFVTANRWSACLACPKLERKAVMTCSACGCNMESKVHFLKSTCPDARWAQ